MFIVCYVLCLRSRIYPALPRGPYVEDRIIQRRERRMKSPGKNFAAIFAEIKLSNRS